MGHGAGGSESWSRRDDRVLHTRLLRRDPTAPAELADRLLPPLIEWLHRMYRQDDPALLETVAVDLILDFAERPEQYNPDLLGLPAYLHMAARGDRLNALEKETRRSTHLTFVEDVELSPSVRNTLREQALDPAETVADALGDERVEAMLERFSGPDRAVVELIVDGERRTERYAEVLSIQDRLWDEQMRDVKRAKDRLKARMKRLWARLDGDD